MAVPGRFFREEAEDTKFKDTLDILFEDIEHYWDHGDRRLVQIELKNELQVELKNEHDEHAEQVELKRAAPANDPAGGGRTLRTARRQRGGSRAERRADSKG